MLGHIVYNAICFVSIFLILFMLWLIECSVYKILTHSLVWPTRLWTTLYKILTHSLAWLTRLPGTLSLLHVICLRKRVNDCWNLELNFRVKKEYFVRNLKVSIVSTIQEWRWHLEHQSSWSNQRKSGLNLGCWHWARTQVLCSFWFASARVCRCIFSPIKGEYVVQCHYRRHHGPAPTPHQRRFLGLMVNVRHEHQAILILGTVVLKLSSSSTPPPA